MNTTFDTIVIGLGAMGSAASYQLAKKGNKVFGIDQFSPPHTFGSTHGDTRITRQAIGEGAEYVPLVLRSYEIWKEIEKETGKNLLTITGGLIMAHATENQFLQQTIDSAKKYGIKHEILDVNTINKRFPQFKLSGNELGYYEYNAGFLRPELCVEVQLQLAKKYGADIHMNEKVFTIESKPDLARIITNKGSYQTKKVIVSVGSWIHKFIDKKYSDKFKVVRQVLFWFDVKNSITPFLPENCPIYIWEYSDGSKNSIYGFPAIDGPQGGVKIACEIETPTNVEAINRTVSSDEIQSMYDIYIKNYFPDLSNKCIRSAVCLYTNTPDHNFVIDFDEKNPNIIIASPCSGHGFKHSAAIGEVLSELVIDGKSKIDISAFKLSRLKS